MLTGRWERIVEDYRAVVKAHDPTTLGLTRYATPDLLAKAGLTGRGGSILQPARGEAWYRKELYAIAEPVIQASLGTVRRGPLDVVVGISITTGSVHLDRTIVLEYVRTVTGSTNGTAFGAQGCTQSTVTGSQNLRIQLMTWENLYNEAKARGIR